jgi:uncharacterized protein (DUF1778 family)
LRQRLERRVDGILVAAYNVRTLQERGIPVTTARARTIRSRRINLRATDHQEKLIRTGAETAGASLTDFILESACLQAEHVLADKRDFVATPKQWQAFVEALDRPARVKPELARLFSGRRKKDFVTETTEGEE